MTRTLPAGPTSDNCDAVAGVPRFWRGLDELAATNEFEELLHREFPRGASAWDTTSLDRRRFLQLMAASLALAGMNGCTAPPAEPIVPNVRPPHGVVPGEPLQFATAMPSPHGAVGLLATSHMGRPTKLEGNQLHPASLGATDALAQASILTLYDPDRSQTVTQYGEISTWAALLDAMREAFTVAQPQRGAGVHILSEPITSPTLARQMRALLKMLPDARWHQYTPIHRDSPRAAALQALGEDLQPLYRFDRADVVVSLNADFLTRGGGAVRYARDFMARRDVRDGRTEMNRLYAIESGFSPTGAAADHRMPLSPSQIIRFTDHLARALGVEVAGTNLPDNEHTVNTTDEDIARWVQAVATDLREAGRNGVVIVGDHQPPALHTLTYAINQRLGSIGHSVQFIRPIHEQPVGNIESLRELVAALNEGSVELLIILEGNPVYNAPADLQFAEALRKARQCVHLSLYHDETSQWCQWHVPAAHYLESWSDARAFDGTAAIVQPLIAPLYGGKTAHEVLSAFLGTGQSSYDVVRETWERFQPADFESFWHQSLHDGMVADTQFEPVTPRFRSNGSGQIASTTEQTVEAGPKRAGQSESTEVVFLPDPCVGDGTDANNGWLQELPKPLTKLTWDNALLLAPATAESLGMVNEDIVQLDCEGRSITAPVWILPGHAAGCGTLHFGYGRWRAGRVANGIGFNAYRLWTSDSGSIRADVQIAKTGRRATLACTQLHHAIDGRNIVATSPLERYLEDPHSVVPHHGRHASESLYPDFPYDGFAWGMAIDLTKCIGCNACVVACQAENNIPVVGKEQVLLGREMHWLRIDQYFSGEPGHPQTVQQPMLCQHCEKAPCEVVCPVAATTHSDEGLNEMTYNRCVGTRYCSNNCPYKVRRFNFLQYQNETTPVLKLLRNLEVTVRSRGVMEKCMYCVQRINRARIDAKKRAVNSGEPPRIEDGTLQTACQAACPSQAIVFGDINDPNSEVTKLKAQPRNYGVLSELGTRPRTTYLVKLRNPNPRLM